jgi:hypothetical protein
MAYKARMGRPKIKRTAAERRALKDAIRERKRLWKANRDARLRGEQVDSKVDAKVDSKPIEAQITSPNPAPIVNSHETIIGLVDALLNRQLTLYAIESKAGKTLNAQVLKELNTIREQHATEKKAVEASVTPPAEDANFSLCEFIRKHERELGSALINGIRHSKSSTERTTLLALCIQVGRFDEKIIPLPKPRLVVAKHDKIVAINA